MTGRGAFYFLIMAMVLVIIGFGQSWNLALAILNLCLISSIMALGVNIQWGYAGLFNVGMMGSAALGGAAAVLIATPPYMPAWQAGGGSIALLALATLATIAATIFVRRATTGRIRLWATVITVFVGYMIMRQFYSTGVTAVEATDPALAGNLGGLGLPILFSWPVGGLFAAGAAWIVGKIALGLRSDYLAISTLGISEIIVYVMKNEDWLTRGVKNVTGLPRPVPYEVALAETAWLQNMANDYGWDLQTSSSVIVKLCYACLFLTVLALVMWLSERALNAPWGRMMRAIRDNRDAAEAMGKNVTARHLQVFILGSAVCGIAGAMLTTLDGQFTPTSYIPLRFTFLIWVMVILGGSGNNWGSVLGGFVIWVVWIEAEPAGLWLMDVLTSVLGDSNPVRLHLMENAAQMRLFLMGAILLTVMRFAPRGLIPERTRHA